MPSVATRPTPRIDADVVLHGTWDYSTGTTIGDPGALRLAADDPLTTFSIASMGRDGDHGAELAGLRVDDELWLQERTTGQNWATFRVNATPQGFGTWWAVPVFRLNGSATGDPTNNDDLLVTALRSTAPALPPPYATVDELAAALSTRVTPDNTALLEDCLHAAAAEIDAYLDRIDPMPTPTPAGVVRCNVNRAVEWYKASDAANGAVGIDQVGVLTPPPGDGFARHLLTIRYLRQKWGVG